MDSGPAVCVVAVDLEAHSPLPGEAVSFSGFAKGWCLKRAIDKLRPHYSWQRCRVLC